MAISTWVADREIDERDRLTIHPVRRGYESELRETESVHSVRDHGALCLPNLPHDAEARVVDLLPQAPHPNELQQVVVFRLAPPRRLDE